jgi:hypothetical protein
MTNNEEARDIISVIIIWAFIISMTMACLIFAIGYVRGDEPCPDGIGSDPYHPDAECFPMAPPCPSNPLVPNEPAYCLPG